MRICLVALLAACCPPPAAKAPQTAVGSATPIDAAPVPAHGGDTLDTLVDSEKLLGFTVAAVYLDDADHPIGARFVHDQTGFTLDYLRIESAPQGYIWVNTYPTSDKGEPHTQEHLLLGKGDRGRKLGSFEAMALAESSAFTEQWHTAYHFHTVAGNDVFWPVFENQLDAALYPDYTDEEIRREVRNFGVDKGDDGKLHLDEKGTVYNEMVRDYETPGVVAWRAAKQAIYGAQHPLALDSGGEPSSIRTMTPADIRAFHGANYHLANMGVIGAFPSALALTSVLDHTAAILTKEASRDTGKVRVTTEADLPKPAPAAAGTLRVVEYPYADTANPGPMMFAWPATRQLDDTERLLLGLFLDTLAGDESTPLYKQLIDGKTRAIDLGASSVWSMVSSDQGQPAYIGLDGVKPDKLDDTTLTAVRALIVAEVERIAKLPDGDAELVAFDHRVQSRVVDARRRYAKFLDTPPRFGTRRTGSGWFDLLHVLARSKAGKKSLTMRPELTAIEQVLAGTHNPWRDRVKTWGLTEPMFGVAARPSPALRKQLDAARDQRIAGELARLQKQFATDTLVHAKADYDAATKQLEASAKAVELPPLVATPPMTLDDNLKYDTGELAATRTFTATFDAMASARVSLAFSLVGAVPGDDEMFLAALPGLLDDVGVIDNGTPIASGEMKDRLRKELLELSVTYIGNPRTHRRELQIAGAGNGAGETKAALAWMRRVMFAPDWRLDNLPRIRDVVDQQLTALRATMLNEEEFWVDGPRDTWWQQSSLQAHTESFLTQIHDLHRLRWMLLDPHDAKITAEVGAFLATLAGAGTRKRAELVELTKTLAAGEGAAAKLSAGAKPLARAAGKDLALALGDIPDDSLATDWRYLCREMAKDLAFGAPAALAKLNEARAQIIQGPRARLVEVGSTANEAAIAVDVDALVHALPIPQHAVAVGADIAAGPVRTRLQQRVPAAKHPVFVGLVAPSTSSGVFLDLAPSTSYADTTDDAVLDYLASNLYTGHGAHSMFMKTWAAGLAYSNGLHPHVAMGTLDYYAERCPLLPQTLRFVIDELNKQTPDPNIARYAIATAFDSRIADGYETRAARMAADLADELPPDVVRAFRSRLLEQSKRADLAQVLYARMLGVYAKVLPGLGKLAPAGTYFVIGNAKQLAAYQDYLHAAVAKDATLFSLYPRDFWIPAKL